MSSAQKKGIMFLNEVAIGNQKVIQRDDSSLVAAPKGYDSVLAKGTQEPGKMCFPMSLSPFDRLELFT